MPTHADADLILKLYDLRREETMRKARNFMFSFFPQTVDDAAKIVRAFGTEENAYFRQVVGYWEMAATFVVQGILDRELFFATNGEMWFVYSKFRPMLKELREAFNSPDFLKNVEAVAEATPGGKERLARMDENVKRVRQMQAAAQKQAS
jgi:hypothetical protein